MARDLHGAMRTLLQSTSCAHRGGLARAIRPNQSVNIAREKLQSQIIDSYDIGEINTETAYRKKRLRHGFHHVGNNVKRQDLLGPGNLQFQLFSSHS